MATYNQIISMCEDRSADLLDNHRDGLDAFVDDPATNKYIEAKIIIALAIAQRLSLQVASEGHGNDVCDLDLTGL